MFEHVLACFSMCQHVLECFNSQHMNHVGYTVIWSILEFSSSSWFKPSDSVPESILLEPICYNVEHPQLCLAVYSSSKYTVVITTTNPTVIVVMFTNLAIFWPNSVEWNVTLLPSTEKAKGYGKTTAFPQKTVYIGFQEKMMCKYLLDHARISAWKLRENWGTPPVKTSTSWLPRDLW